MSDELDDLLTGPDEGFPERAAGGEAEPQAGNGEAAAHAEDVPAPAGESPAGEPATVVGKLEDRAGDEAVTAVASDAEMGGAQPDEPPVSEEPPKPAKPRVPRPPIEELSQERPPITKDWYILKVQSNREDSIADALQRRIAIAGLGDYFDEIIVPTEKVSEFKAGKKRIVKRKIYPGYIVVHMELNDDTWFLVRETPGIGDFTGSGGKPTPMLPNEVAKIVSKPEDSAVEQVRNAIPFNQGDRVRIKEGTFENFEGDVDNIDQASGRVTIMINIFGRSTPVELEYYQAEKL
ncbi:MAG TPA: transcription termination/antitermination protein NusG [Pirellulales bacterium]|nr:transcription termination/antitermination protein NusG [Pirellulales bacterium]